MLTSSISYHLFCIVWELCVLRPDLIWKCGKLSWCTTLVDSFKRKKFSYRGVCLYFYPCSGARGFLQFTLPPFKGSSFQVIPCRHHHSWEGSSSQLIPCSSLKQCFKVPIWVLKLTYFLHLWSIFTFSILMFLKTA